MKFAIIGCGSIGERHLGNLQSLDAGEILVFDTSPERLAYIRDQYSVRVFSSLDKIFENQIDALIICVPPSYHMPFALEGIKHNAHLFIEKPLSHNLDKVDMLINRNATAGLIVQIGYNLRFHPGLKLVKQMIDQNSIGRILAARVEAGQYLPDWHPWQDYREMYVAKEELGGGIILDGSHEIDYIRWLLGEIAYISCFAGRISNLEVETEDTAEILLRFCSNAVAGVHMDFIQRTYSRSCKIIGEEGTIIWDYPENEVRVFFTQTGCWEKIKVDFEPNDMYMEEMRHFIECINGARKPLVDLRTARRVLQIALAVKEAAVKGMVVKV